MYMYMYIYIYIYSHIVIISSIIDMIINSIAEVLIFKHAGEPASE